ncbi:MAG: sulfite exporter TauE/SafE family protein [Acidimicrobiia bacterium]|nr:sulfite exporter TauE/SafE family protein [Acidimicrobiia bacterium]
MEHLGYALAGFCVALLCTPAGVSGAFLLLPVQVLIFGAPSPTVSATNLLYNLVATPTGIRSMRRHGRFDRQLTALLLTGVVPGMVIGVLVRATVLADQSVFAVVAALVLIALGVHLAVGHRIRRGGPEVSMEPAVVDAHVARLRCAAVVAGVIGGIYGLGGAALLVPWMVAVERIGLRRAAASGLVVTLATSMVGLTAFLVAAALGVGAATGPAWLTGLALGVGGAGGAALGASLQDRLPVALLRWVLALAAALAGVRLLMV